MQAIANISDLSIKKCTRKFRKTLQMNLQRSITVSFITLRFGKDKVKDECSQEKKLQ